MARLDRLGSAKEVAQIGAAIGREFSYALLAAVVRKPEAELVSALDRLIAAGLLFRQGVPPHATLSVQARLVQDAAYGTLLRQPRRALHARIAETLESQFAEIAENQPELLARHCTEAGLIEKAAGLWGKAGQRSLERSALVEAVAQFTRALDQIATLPGTPALRREQIKLQVALINALMHIKGYAAPETKAAVERARLLIEQAEAFGEPPEDPLLLFSVLYGFWIANYVAFNGDIVRELAAQFLALAEKQGATVPLMIGHRLMGTSLMSTGDIAEGQAHLDQRARALRSCRASSAGDAIWPRRRRGASCAFGPGPCGCLAIPRPRSQTLTTRSRMRARSASRHADVRAEPCTVYHIFCGNYAKAKSLVDELAALADEKGDCVVEGARNDATRLAFCLDRQSRGRCSQDHLRHQRMAVNGSNIVDTLLLIKFGESLCGTRSIR